MQVVRRTCPSGCSRALILGAIASVAASCRDEGPERGMQTSGATVDSATSTDGGTGTAANDSGDSDSSESAALDSSSDGPPGAAAFTIEEVGTTRIATSTADPRFVVEVDCDDATADGREFGIAPVIADKRFEIAMYGGPLFPLFAPDFDAGEARCVSVESDETRLLVRLEAGSYQTLDPAAADQPVPVDAAFSIEAGHLVASVSGLYYSMLTRANTELEITAGGEVVVRTIMTGTPAFTEYFDDVTRIIVDDSIYGPLTIETAIPRLQIQLYDDGSEGFELDVDHSFKELGQMSVMSTITFP
jgi:hypothetical protein